MDTGPLKSEYYLKGSSWLKQAMKQPSAIAKTIGYKPVDKFAMQMLQIGQNNIFGENIFRKAQKDRLARWLLELPASKPQRQRNMEARIIQPFRQEEKEEQEEKEKKDKETLRIENEDAKDDLDEDDSSESDSDKPGKPDKPTTPQAPRTPAQFTLDNITNEDDINTIIDKFNQKFNTNYEVVKGDVIGQMQQEIQDKDKQLRDEKLQWKEEAEALLQKQDAFQNTAIRLSTELEAEQEKFAQESAIHEKEIERLELLHEREKQDIMDDRQTKINEIEQLKTNIVNLTNENNQVTQLQENLNQMQQQYEAKLKDQQTQNNIVQQQLTQRLDQQIQNTKSLDAELAQLKREERTHSPAKAQQEKEMLEVLEQEIKKSYDLQLENQRNQMEHQHNQQIDNIQHQYQLQMNQMEDTFNEQLASANETLDQYQRELEIYQDADLTDARNTDTYETQRLIIENKPILKWEDDQISSKSRSPSAYSIEIQTDTPIPARHELRISTPQTIQRIQSTYTEDSQRAHNALINEYETKLMKQQMVLDERKAELLEYESKEADQQDEDMKIQALIEQTNLQQQRIAEYKQKIQELDQLQQKTLIQVDKAKNAFQELEQTKQKLQQLRNEAEQTKVSQLELAETKAELEITKGIVSRKDTQIAQHEQKAQHKDNEMKSMQEQINTLEASIAMQNSQIKHAEQAKAQLQKEIDDIWKTIDLKNKQNMSLAQWVKWKQDDSRTANEQVRERDETITRLKKQLAEKIRNERELSNKNVAMRQEMIDLKEQAGKMALQKAQGVGIMSQQEAQQIKQQAREHIQAQESSRQFHAKLDAIQEAEGIKKRRQQFAKQTEKAKLTTPPRVVRKEITEKNKEPEKIKQRTKKSKTMRESMAGFLERFSPTRLNEEEKDELAKIEKERKKRKQREVQKQKRKEHKKAKKHIEKYHPATPPQQSDKDADKDASVFESPLNPSKVDTRLVFSALPKQKESDFKPTPTAHIPSPRLNIHAEKKFDDTPEADLPKFDEKPGRRLKYQRFKGGKAHPAVEQWEYKKHKMEQERKRKEQTAELDALVANLPYPQQQPPVQIQMPRRRQLTMSPSQFPSGATGVLSQAPDGAAPQVQPQSIKPNTLKEIEAWNWQKQLCDSKLDVTKHATSGPRTRTTFNANVTIMDACLRSQNPADQMTISTLLSSATLNEYRIYRILIVNVNRGDNKPNHQWAKTAIDTYDRKWGETATSIYNELEKSVEELKKINVQNKAGRENKMNEIVKKFIAYKSIRYTVAGNMRAQQRGDREFAVTKDADTFVKKVLKNQLSYFDVNTRKHYINMLKAYEQWEGQSPKNVYIQNVAGHYMNFFVKHNRDSKITMKMANELYKLNKFKLHDPKMLF